MALDTTNIEAILERYFGNERYAPFILRKNDAIAQAATQIIAPLVDDGHNGVIFLARLNKLLDFQVNRISIPELLFSQCEIGPNFFFSNYEN